ncbi:MAG: hypothetical protein ACOYN0_19230 [Phycisphaerales bacterium]
MPRPEIPRRAPLNDIPSQYTTSAPGLVLFMLDQSRSMVERDPATSETKAETATRMLLRCVDEILAQSLRSSAPVDRMFIMIIGYCGTKDVQAEPPDPGVQLLEAGWPGDLIRRHPKNPATGLRTPPIIAVAEPVLPGTTPMDLAFDLATQMIAKFFSDPDLHKGRFANSAPPLVINVTDGEPDDLPKKGYANQRLPRPERNTRESVMRLKSLKTGCYAQHRPLVFNAHITLETAQPIMFPTQAWANAQTDPWVRFLAEISDYVPRPWVDAARKSGTRLDDGALGLLINSRPEAIFEIITIGTLSSRTLEG